MDFFLQRNVTLVPEETEQFRIIFRDEQSEIIFAASWVIRSKTEMRLIWIENSLVFLNKPIFSFMFSVSEVFFNS